MSGYRTNWNSKSHLGVSSRSRDRAGQFWYSWAGSPENITRDFVPSLGVQPNSLVEPPKLLPIFLQNLMFTPGHAMIRHAIVEDVGGFEESFRGILEDQVFFAKVCLKAPVFVSSECWYRYRRHPDSCSSIALQGGQNYSARLTFLNWLEEYLKKNQVDDREVWAALRKRLWPYRHAILYRLSGCIQLLYGRLKSAPRLVSRVFHELA
jgi:hypothetical protein